MFHDIPLSITVIIDEKHSTTPTKQFQRPSTLSYLVSVASNATLRPCSAIINKTLEKTSEYIKSEDLNFDRFAKK